MSSTPVYHAIMSPILLALVACSVHDGVVGDVHSVDVIGVDVTLDVLQNTDDVHIDTSSPVDAIEDAVSVDDVTSPDADSADGPGPDAESVDVVEVSDGLGSDAEDVVDEDSSLDADDVLEEDASSDAEEPIDVGDPSDASDVGDASTPTCSVDGVACDDGDSCTSGDTCFEGACSGNTIDCSHLDSECSAGACQAGGCVAVPAGCFPFSDFRAALQSVDLNMTPVAGHSIRGSAGQGWPHGVMAGPTGHRIEFGRRAP